MLGVVAPWRPYVSCAGLTLARKQTRKQIRVMWKRGGNTPHRRVEPYPVRLFGCPVSGALLNLTRPSQSAAADRCATEAHG